MRAQFPHKTMVDTVWKILVIDDDEDDFLIARDMLKEARGRKFDVHWANSFTAGREELISNHYNAVLVDYDLGIHSGIELIREASERGYAAPLILFTGRGSYEVDVEAMEAGATLYLSKGEATPLLLERVIRYAIELKHKEQSLRESEARERQKVAEMNAIMDAVPAIVWITHDTGAIEVTGNRAAHDLLRVPTEKNLSKSASEDAPRNFTVYKDGRELAPEELPLQITAATGKPIRNFEEEVVFEDGDHAHLLGNVTPLLDDEGKPCGAVAAFINITERKQDEQALKKVEEKFTKAFYSSPVALSIIRAADGRFIEINESLCQLTGYDRDELNEHSVVELGLDATPDQLAELTRLLRVQGHIRNHEIEVRTRSGSIQTILASIDLIELDREPCILATLINITKRKRAEEQLAFTASLLDSIHDAVIALDPDLHIITWNKSAEKLYGFTAQEAIGQKPGDLLRSEINPEQRASILELLKERGEGSLELVQYSKNGDRLMVEGKTITRRDSHGNITGYVTAYRDITERKKAEEEQREHRVQIETQRRLLNYREQERQMIAREIHDGPVQDLSSLLFDVQFMKEPILEPKLKEELDQISRRLIGNIQHLREMINDMRPPSLIRFGLVKALEIYLEEFKENYPDIALQTSLANDGDRLSEQARINLYRIAQEALNNVTKHGDATKIAVTFTGEDHRTILKIVDNGKGFSVSDSLDAYSTQDHFGLVGMKERVEAIGGTLDIVSRPRHGTTILVTVPVDH